MPNLALFDFDGTITSSDTFVPFLFFALPKRRLAVGKILLSPWILGYKLGLLPATKLRARLVRFAFTGSDAAQVARLGREYARENLPAVIRPNARERLEKHLSAGDTVVVVSASLDAYLKPWCESLGLDLIATRLEAAAGTLTGRYDGGDCTGAEKARRIEARFDLGTFGAVFAYGDTPEDLEMLALASHRIYRWQPGAGGRDQP